MVIKHRKQKHHKTKHNKERNGATKKGRTGIDISSSQNENVHIQVYARCPRTARWNHSGLWLRDRNKELLLLLLSPVSGAPSVLVLITFSASQRRTGYPWGRTSLSTHAHTHTNHPTRVGEFHGRPHFSRILLYAYILYLYYTLGTASCVVSPLLLQVVI